MSIPFAAMPPFPPEPPEPPEPGRGMPSVNGHTLTPSSTSLSTGPAGHADLVEVLRQQVAADLAAQAKAAQAAGIPLDTVRRDQVVNDVLAEVLQAHARAEIAAGRAPMTPDGEAVVRRAVRDAVLGLGGFEQLLADPTIENIDANGCDVVFVTRTDGRVEQVGPVAASDEDLVEVVRQIAARSGEEERRFDRGTPRLWAQLPDGSRLSAAMAVCSRPAVSIRRHLLQQVALTDLVHRGTIEAGLASFLAAAVRARKNILIAGGPRGGKTTFLRALASQIPPLERLITIEDTLELNLDKDPAHPNVQAWQSRESNVEGEGEITAAELTRWALRFNADRVIVGEVRGPEVVSMCNVMAQGCDGSMATIHASDSRQVLWKLASYAAQSAERLPFESTGAMVAAAVHLVVQLAWTRDKTRVVSSVREVVDCEGRQVITNEIWEPGPDRRARPAAPIRIETLEELIEVGFDPRALDNRAGWWNL